MDTVPAKQPVRSSRFRAIVSNILYIGAAIGLAALIQAFIIRPFIVSGDSMHPIIKNKEYLLIDEVSFRFRDPARGEVVVFRSPPEPTKYYIKRIIGLPGETVSIKNGVITIINTERPDGFTLNEPYIVNHLTDTNDYHVPEGSYFVMGDNRSASYDSRGWGALPQKAIKGRALVRLLPFSRIDYLPGATTYAL